MLKNLDMLNFNQQITDDVNKFMHPFFNNTGSSFFIYRRFIRGKGIVYICSQPEWVKFRQEKLRWEDCTFRNEAKSLEPGKASYYTWCDFPNPEDSLYTALYEKNIWKGISRYFYDEDSIEIIGLAGDRSSDLCAEKYLALMGQLEETFHQFKCFFEKDIFQRNKGTFVPYTDQSIWKDMKKPLNLKTKNENNSKVLLKDSDDNFAEITQREGQILRDICSGCTMKESAEIRKISLRTVEGHLKKIKLKTGFSSKSKLIQAYNKLYM